MSDLILPIVFVFTVLCAFRVLGGKLNRRWESEGLISDENDGAIFVEYGGLITKKAERRSRQTWPLSKIIVRNDSLTIVDRIRDKCYFFQFSDLNGIQFRRSFPMIFQGFKVKHHNEMYPEYICFAPLRYSKTKRLFKDLGLFNDKPNK